MKPKGPFLTTGDVARYCHVTTNAVKKWIREKNLPSFRTPGGHFRIKAEDFEAFVRHHRMPMADAVQDDRLSRVLVVDDDADVLSFVTTALSQAADRMMLATASDGYEALIAIGRFKPDLLILDIKMPRIDGMEVCRQLKTSPSTREIKIVLMTAFPSKQHTKRAKELGVEEILIKPFSLSDLADTTERLLPGAAPVSPTPVQV